MSNSVKNAIRYVAKNIGRDLTYTEAKILVVMFLVMESSTTTPWSKIQAVYPITGDTGVDFKMYNLMEAYTESIK